MSLNVLVMEPQSAAQIGFLFERFRAALPRESAMLMPFPFPQTPIACGAKRIKRLNEDEPEVSV